MSVTPPPARDTEPRIVPSTCWECSTTCGSLLSVKGSRVVDVKPNRAHPGSKGAFCAKGIRAAPEWTYREQRLLSPLKRRGARGSRIPLVCKYFANGNIASPLHGEVPGCLCLLEQGIKHVGCTGEFPLQEQRYAQPHPAAPGKKSVVERVGEISSFFGGRPRLDWFTGNNAQDCLIAED